MSDFDNRFPDGENTDNSGMNGNSPLCDENPGAEPVAVSSDETAASADGVKCSHDDNSGDIQPEKTEYPHEDISESTRPGKTEVTHKDNYENHPDGRFGGGNENSADSFATSEGGYSQYQGGYIPTPNMNQYPYGQQNRQYGFYGQPPVGNGNAQRVNYGQPEYNNGEAMAQPPKGRKTGRVILIALLCIVAVFAAVAIAVSIINNDGKDAGTETTLSANVVESVSGVENGPTVSINGVPQTASGVAPATGELSSVEVYRKISDASVGILVYESSSEYVSSEGSGVIMGEDESGEYTYIITCAHVINASGAKIFVHLNDNQGNEHEAETIGFDTRTDIGVLRIKASGLVAAEFGDTQNLEVGQTVYAIGNPGGVEFADSFTNGIVSAISRPVASGTGYTMKCIQHNAAINPGNSGGALLNAYGQVIGINSMKIVDTDYEGMGFAVPSDIVKNVVDEIIANGYVPNRPKIGISYRPASYYNSYNMIIQLKDLPEGSIVIEAITDDSPLKNTDAAVYDLIIGVNGTALEHSDYLREVIEKSAVGDTLTLTLVRITSNYEVKQFEVKVTLVEDRGTVAVEPETTVPETTFNFDDFFNGKYDLPY